ncbi:MAG: sugar ABC transporter permease [Clostridia bacterium]|nr:sugar ABC transporter permease [Clostridia bacterium]
MNFLDYAQMTTGQKIAYNIKSFFTGIPGAFAKIFAAIGGFFKGLFTLIGKGFAGYGERFVKGDAGTKLSYVIMGAGNMMHGQIGKGLVFLAVEAAYIIYMINFGMSYITKIYSTNVQVDENTVVSGVIGKIPPQYEEDPIFHARSVTNLDTLDDSNKVLLFFVMTVLVCIAFLAIYVTNTKSAYATQQIKESGKKPIGFFAEMKTFLDERFHVTLLTIPVLGLLIFTVLPIIFTIFMAFTNYDKEHQPPGNMYWWVGFKNFADIFYSNPDKSATFGKILVWTIVWAIFATFTNYIFGIILALLINKKEIKFKGFWRTMFVVTAAVPQFVTLLICSLLLADSGPINETLHSLGLSTIPFLSDAGWARVTVIVVNMWVGIPYTMLISSGLLMNIPEDLYESARIDGANAFQQFTKITFPYIFFVTTPYLITTFVGNINNFNVIYFLTGGGPSPAEYYKAGQTDLLVTWLYKLTTVSSDFNLASVIGIIVFVICATGSLITFNMSKASKNEEEFS